MPSEKEIEEAIEWAKGRGYGGYEEYFIDAYLSMKADRDEWKAESDINEKKWCDASEERDKAEAERDKYKAIVEADTQLLCRCFDIESSERIHNIIEEALALREKES